MRSIRQGQHVPEADGRGRALLLTGGLLLAAAVLAAVRLATQLPPTLWFHAAFHPNLDDPAELVVYFASLPRLATAALCGAALGLAGALLQQTLRNPLASPTTLGIEAGTQLALTAATVYAPVLLAPGPEWVGLAGAACAMAAVFACAAMRGLTSLSLILAGLVVGLFCVSLSACLKLLNQEYAAILFLWGGGSLVQQDWSVPAFLAPRIAALAVAAALAFRPLAVLSLDDAGARSLGTPVGLVRAIGTSIAVMLTAFVTATVGIIGFVGLAAPQIARLAGARRFGDRLVLAPLVGAGLLVVVDSCVGALADRVVMPLPTGAATALLGAPLLLWLLPRIRLANAPPAEAPTAVTGHRAGTRLVAGLGVAVALAFALALVIGRDAAGWTFAAPPELALVAPWRVPRTVVALLAGGMLATAGLVLQRVTANPMASPEILGLGTGVAAGLAAAFLLVPTLGLPARWAAGAVGAAAALLALLAIGARARFAPDQLLLAGIALSALLDSFVVAFLALGNEHALELLAFVSGSTYRADAATALVTVLLALVLVPATVLLRRWLDIVPLGGASAVALGLPLTAVRIVLTGMAALLTAAAVLVTGPLSFVGLMAPHAARLLGVRRAAPQAAASFLIGGGVMMLADWVGRNAIYPRQLPAGLVAALIGMPYLFWQLSRRPA